MITGELKSKVDRIWDTMWSGGISNPLSVIEQLTYLLFIKRLDELLDVIPNSWTTIVLEAPRRKAPGRREIDDAEITVHRGTDRARAT
jgi:hypothetical protein